MALIWSFSGYYRYMPIFLFEEFDQCLHGVACEAGHTIPYHQFHILCLVSVEIPLEMFFPWFCPSYFSILSLDYWHIGIFPVFPGAIKRPHTWSYWMKNITVPHIIMYLLPKEVGFYHNGIILFYSLSRMASAYYLHTHKGVPTNQDQDCLQSIRYDNRPTKIT